VPGVGGAWYVAVEAFWSIELMTMYQNLQPGMRS
jgi:hypothetical protein